VKALLSSSILTLLPCFARPDSIPSGTCSGVVRISADPKLGAELDCESPCTDACSVFLVMTRCGEAAQCGCSTVGPNSGADVTLFPPASNGIPCIVGTCPNGQPPQQDIEARRGRRSPTGHYYTIKVRAKCGS
jgi:hypothetical protein